MEAPIIKLDPFCLKQKKWLFINLNFLEIHYLVHFTENTTRNLIIVESWKTRETTKSVNLLSSVRPLPHCLVLLPPRVPRNFHFQPITSPSPIIHCPQTYLSSLSPLHPEKSKSNFSFIKYIFFFPFYSFCCCCLLGQFYFSSFFLFALFWVFGGAEKDGSCSRCS